MKLLATTMTALVLASATSVMAQPVPPPEQNISQWRHGNLAAAQAELRQAYDRLSSAQRANHGQLGGHVDHAKVLIDQASAEIKAAAEYANSMNWPNP